MSIKVPILHKIVDNDSTVYYFSESNNDLLKQITSKTKRRVPSKFVCLNLPDWENLSGAARQLFKDPADYGTSPLIIDPNDLVPATMQNYMENMIAYAKDESEFYHGLTEYSFWKMLKHFGAFDPAIDSSDPNNRYKDDFGDGHDLITYIGDINVMNHVEYQSEEYSELYLHIPHDAKKVKDVWWNRNTTDYQNVTSLPGTPPGDPDAFGLSGSTWPIKKALYDTNDGTPTGTPLTYYDFTQPESTLKLDFDNYTTEQEEFQYNSILIYYDTYDVDANGNAINIKRKLGAILFVDKFEQQGVTGTWTIRPFVKKLNTNKNTGNSLAHRINSRFFYGNNMITEQTIVNQYNTVSMDLYMTALSTMMSVVNKYTSIESEFEVILQQLANLQQINTTVAQFNAIQQQVMQLSTQVNNITSGNAQATQITTQELLDVFDTFVTQLQQYQDGIVQGNTPTFSNVFQFNTSASSSINFDNFYIAVDPISNKTVANYAKESMLTNAKFRTYISTQFDITAKVVNIGGTNVIEFNIQSLSGSALVSHHYDKPTDTMVQTSLPSSMTSTLTFNTVDDRDRTVWIYDFITSTLLFVPFEQYRDELQQTSLLLAAFYHTTEANFYNRNSSLFVPLKDANIDINKSHFAFVNGQLSLGTGLTFMLQDNAYKLITAISTSVSGTPTEIVIDILTQNNKLIWFNTDTNQIESYVVTPTLSIQTPFVATEPSTKEMVILFDTTSSQLQIIDLNTYINNGGYLSNPYLIGKIVVPTLTTFTDSGNHTWYQNYQN